MSGRTLLNLGLLVQVPFGGSTSLQPITKMSVMDHWSVLGLEKALNDCLFLCLIQASRC